MCVGYPAQVTGLGPDGTATVVVHGRPQRVALLAIPEEEIGPGDWVLVHSGIALARLDAAEALARQRLIEGESS